MSKIQRQKVAKHILVPDTNILWDLDKANCVSPKFQNFWDEIANQYDIELILPEVVHGELQFQQTTSALNALRKANDHFDRMSEIAASQYTHGVDEKKVRSDVEQKLSIWLQSTNCSVYKSPVETIDWNRLINDAIWRLSPFVEDKGKVIEKGFRDAIILETVDAISMNHSDVDLAFVSSDGLLREATEKRLGMRCNVYETTEEFETYLKLLNEELTNKFVTAIQNRARAKFFTDKDDKCLLYRENLTDRIKKEFSSEFLLPGAEYSSGLMGGLLSTDENKWESVTNESIWIRAPKFISLTGKNDVLWRSTIIFVQLFRVHSKCQ